MTFSIHWRILKASQFPQKTLNNTTVFNIDINNKYFLSSKSTHYNDLWRVLTLKTGIAAFLLHCKVYKDRKVIWNVTILIIPHCYHIFMNTNNVCIKTVSRSQKYYFASPRQFLRSSPKEENILYLKFLCFRTGKKTKRQSVYLSLSS